MRFPLKAPARSLLWRSLRVYQVYGANTEVGKTVGTTLLCKAARRHWKNEETGYVKPVSTGAATDADDLCTYFQILCLIFIGPTFYLTSLHHHPHSTLTFRQMTRFLFGPIAYDSGRAGNSIFNIVVGTSGGLPLK